MPGNGALILTPTELANIRKYVQHKFAGLPKERHAEIVADAVYRIIMRQLPQFEYAVKEQLTSVLIRSTVSEEKRPVHAEDIFDLSLKLGLHRSDFEPLFAWVNTRLQTNLSREELHDLLLAQDSQHEQFSSVWARLVTISEERINHSETCRIGESPVTPGTVILLFPKVRKRVHPVLYGILSLVLVGSLITYHSLTGTGNKTEPETLKPVWEWMPKLPVTSSDTRIPNELPQELQYKQVDIKRLKLFLESRSSILAEPPYFEAIVDTAKAYNIHPVLMFAITGQEQGFVPKNHQYAKQIANNPFNVFHSWKEYNTTIHDSAEIAARTVLRWSRDRPDGIDAIVWINRKYAEDRNWHKGVNKLFGTMLHYVQSTT